MAGSHPICTYSWIFQNIFIKHLCALAKTSPVVSWRPRRGSVASSEGSTLLFFLAPKCCWWFCPCPPSWKSHRWEFLWNLACCNQWLHLFSWELEACCSQRWGLVHLHSPSGWRLFPSDPQSCSKIRPQPCQASSAFSSFQSMSAKFTLKKLQNFVCSVHTCWESTCWGLICRHWRCWWIPSWHSNLSASFHKLYRFENWDNTRKSWALLSQSRHDCFLFTCCHCSGWSGEIKSRLAFLQTGRLLLKEIYFLQVFGHFHCFFLPWLLLVFLYEDNFSLLMDSGARACF